MRVLFVDLLYKTTQVKEYNYKTGGYELASILLDEYPSSIIISPALLTGTNAPTGGKYVIAGKTRNGIYYGTANGFIGSYIKGYGFGAIIFLKNSDGPLIVEFSKDDVEFKSALNFLNVENDEIFKKFQIGGRRVISVGPAGEMGVKISAIVLENRKIVGKGMGELFFRKGIKALIFIPSTYQFYNSVFMNRVNRLKEKLRAKDEPVETNHPCYGCPIKCAVYTERSDPYVNILLQSGYSKDDVKEIIKETMKKGVDLLGALRVSEIYNKNILEVIKLASEGEDFEPEYPNEVVDDWKRFVDSVGICEHIVKFVEKSDIEKIVEVYKEVVR